jgi:hypothetical protein
MNESERNIRGPSLVDWQLGLSKVLPKLASILQEPADPYAAAQKIGLPTPIYCFFTSVTAFLEQAKAAIAALQRQGVEQLYVGLRPGPGLPKYRELGLHPNQVVPYVADRISRELYGSYQLQLAEYAVADYSFVMIVNPDGSLHADIVPGEMALLATGLAKVPFHARSNPFTGRIEYDFEDMKLRQLIKRALSVIPVSDTWFEAGSAFRGVYPPGYYECSLIRRGGTLRPVYFDFKPIGPRSPFCISTPNPAS